MPSGRHCRAGCRGLPGGLPGAMPGWAADVAAAVAATVAGGRGALVVVPDSRDVAALDGALTSALGPDVHLTLTADLGPAERYRRFLSVVRGQTRVVVGTRAAAFAPVHDLGLVVVWDDGDDLHAEPRAPYPHARDVLLLRAQQGAAAAIVGGHAVSAEGARLVATGWAELVQADRATVRARTPQIRGSDDGGPAGDPGPAARLPTVAWQAARDALRVGAPVLVQVPRRGYAPVLACAGCRAVARCTCGGPLAAAGRGRPATCRWCGRIATGWRCPECGTDRFRALVAGASRTTEELGKAFPGVVVRTSAQGQVLGSVPEGAAVVVATPGAEPLAVGGYGAALLLDGWALLSRADLRAGEEALRRWLNAAALVRPAGEGGRVVVVADAALRPVQALVRWAPAAHAQRELDDRRRVGFPPAVALAEVSGDAAAVNQLLEEAELPVGTQVLGPVPVERRGEAASGVGADPVADSARALLRVDRRGAAALALALRAAQSVRSARKAPGTARVRIDPVDVG